MKWEAKVLLGFIATFVIISVLSRVFDTGYAVKEPVGVESQQVQQELTESSVTPSSILSEDEKNINRIDKFLGGQLKGQALNIVKYSKQYNVNARLVAAIISHETGNGTSYAVKVYKNVGGLMQSNGMTLRKFDSIEQSIEFMVGNLRTQYLDKGLNSIDLISGKYCPVGAVNDKKYNLNQYWLPRVTELYNNITNAEA